MIRRPAAGAPGQYPETAAFIRFVRNVPPVRAESLERVARVGRIHKVDQTSMREHVSAHV
jgi:hypothetical protein